MVIEAVLDRDDLEAGLVETELVGERQINTTTHPAVSKADTNNNNQ